ncbi:MAG TPA: hypothetical protein VMV63_00185 [Acidithiobacillus sp.]|nr:hypothetical protein [Acidithiobacillus sp.]
MTDDPVVAAAAAGLLFLAVAYWCPELIPRRGLAYERLAAVVFFMT